MAVTNEGNSLRKELNEHLAKLDLPFHRKKVEVSGSNLAWLRKHANSRNELTERVAYLLSLTIGQLINGVDS